MKRISGITFLLFAMIVQAQNVKLPRLFQDGAILQRNEPVKFWGWADPDTEVTVSIDGFETQTLSDTDGEWELLYPAHKAGGPFEVKVNDITLKDIYFGDVWVAGGQSNMEWSVGASINNMEEELKDTDYPQIRFFKVAKNLSVKPLSDLPDGEWKSANPDNAKAFSAVAWFFAKSNHLEKKVPVGIIDDNWGGTPAESWVSMERLLSVKGYEDAASKFLDPSVDWEEKFEENRMAGAEKYRRVEDQKEFLKFGVHQLDFDDSSWETISIPNKEALSDFVWLRKSFELKSIKDAKLSFGNPGKFTVAFVNGQKVYTKIWSDDPKVIDIPKEVLRKGENVIAVRTVEDWSNRTFFGKEDEMWISVGKNKIDLSGDWKFSNTIEPPLPKVIRYENEPGTLYNAMINPIVGYTIKGAIWYQGESNVAKADLYQELFEMMIEDWRLKWGQGRFPFLFCQLANFQQRYDYPTESGWAALQEAQTQTLELANTGMACLIDVGEADDIHPRNKQDPGKRLWLAAKKVAYGDDVVHSGPMYKKHSVSGGKVTVEFDLFGSTLDKKGDELVGFALAGKDKKFYWAQAKIEGDKVVLSSEKVAGPVHVRYAWADNPACNLYNTEGLPAVPFRTDK